MKKIKIMIYTTSRSYRYIPHHMSNTLMKYVCYGVNLTRLMIAASLCLVHSQNQRPLIFTLPNIKNC